MLCYVMLCYVMLCYVMLCYVMLCINFITDQNSEEHIRSCLQQEKLSTMASKIETLDLCQRKPFLGMEAFYFKFLNLLLISS